MPTPPTNDELNTLIQARLALVGIDLEQLEPGTGSDPLTGVPRRTTALNNLRNFLRGSVANLGAFELPPAADVDEADVAALSQQTAPPVLYPSIDAGRTGRSTS